MNRNWGDIVALVPANGQSPDWQSIGEVLPEIQALASVQQEPRHHAEGDVLVHTQLCVDAMLNEPAWQNLPRVEQEVLFLATLLHDRGKGFKTVTDIDGIIRAPHHAKAGAIEARSLLWYAGAPIAMRERISNLIALHQVLFHTLDADAPDLDWMLRRASLKTPLCHLIILGRADTLGRLPLQQESLDCLDLLSIRAAELGCLYGPAVFPDAVCRLRYLGAGGIRSADVPTYDVDGSQVTLLSGLPASGKDTWLAGQRTLPSVSFDGTREKLGLKYGENDGMATQDMLEQARVFLRSKTAFAWNQTFLSREMRQRPIKLITDYQGEVHAICLECSSSELYRRNRARAASVPEEAINRMLRKWEPPCLDEVSSVQFLSPDGCVTDGRELLIASQIPMIKNHWVNSAHK